MEDSTTKNNGDDMVDDPMKKSNGNVVGNDRAWKAKLPLDFTRVTRSAKSRTQLKCNWHFKWTFTINERVG